MLKKLVLYFMLVNGFVCFANVENDLSVDKNFEAIGARYEKIANLNSYGEQQKHYEAIGDIYKNLLEKEPKNTEILMKAAEFYSDWGEEIEDKDKSLEILNKGLKIVDELLEKDDKNGVAYFYKGALTMQVGSKKGILSALGSIKLMRDDLLKAIELAPDFSPSYHGLASLYMEAPGFPISIGNKKKALRYRLKSVELEPYNFEYRLKLAKNYEALKRDKEYRKSLEEIIELDPEKDETHKMEKVLEIKEEATKRLKNIT